MKKVVVALLVVAFVASIASVAFARTLEEEREAVRAYLKVLDAKIRDARAKRQTARVKRLQAEKAATLARWNKLKMELEAAPPPPPPPPPPVAPVPPPPPVARPLVVQPVGLFGMGINTALSGQYIYTGKGQVLGSVGLKGDVVLEDFVGLGPMIGLGANDVKYKVGVGGYYGGGKGLKAMTVYAGGIINLPPDMMGGLETYLTGGLNYVVYGNNKTSGGLGGDIYFGILADLGLGLGKTGFEIGWAGVKPNAGTGVPASKGIAISITQPIVL